VPSQVKASLGCGITSARVMIAATVTGSLVTVKLFAPTLVLTTAMPGGSSWSLAVSPDIVK
jgi:hypothetical protein